MKIGFVIDDSLDTTDGVQQYVLLLGSWLSDKGHEVHYLTTKSSRQDVANLHSLGKNLRVKFNRNVVPLVLPSSPRKIAEVLELEKFDVLHVQMPYGPAFGARVITLAPTSTAIVGTFHIAPYSITEKALSSALGYWLKPSSNLFDEVISVSSPAQALAKSSFGFNSEIIPNMVNIASYRLSNKLTHHEPTELIFVGRLVPRKGCEHFIKSLSHLNTPFHATIVGEGNQRAKLEKLVTKLYLKDNITFTGFVDEDKKRKLLSKAEIAVFPATGGESFGIVLVEAMAAGSCVVLAGNNPGYASVLGKLPASLFDPKDHHQFAAILDKYIQDNQAAEDLYNKQQKLVQRYDVDKVARKILAIYKKAVAKRASKSHTSK